MSTEVDRGISPRTLVGYCWPWTVRPGETLDFMVSTESGDASYHADLVKIICAETLADPRMFKEQALTASFNGEYKGRHQDTHIGSYVDIEASPVLDRLENFTVQAMVMPTFVAGGIRSRIGGPPLSTEEPTFQDQYLIARWDNRRGRGWALLLDAEGCPVFMIGDGAGLQRVRFDAPLIQDRWFLVVATYDAKERVASLTVRLASKSDVGWAGGSIRASLGGEQALIHEGPLRFAACTDGPGHGGRLKPAFCFNGRLDRVRLAADVLDEADALSLARAAAPDSQNRSVVGFWDFGIGMDSTTAQDLSGNELHGVVVNMPMRAVAGANWDGSVRDWRDCADHYSAIHFHDDDLYDAEWQSDFRYTVPEDLSSGVYAARLRQGEFKEYIPFFVAPLRGQTTASVALLLPTSTYTAYGNISTFTTQLKRKVERKNANGVVEVAEEDAACLMLQDAVDAEFLVRNLRTLGKGLYANHTDGTLFAVASQKHPNLTIKPNSIQWTLSSDTLIVDWLERKKVAYDVITDDLLHAEGFDLLKGYQVVITGNHPEYYSRVMLDAIEEYRDLGGRLMYLGGNGFFWVTSFNPHLPGAIEARRDLHYQGHWKSYEVRHAFDGEYGGMWEANGRAAQLLVGVSTTQNTVTWEATSPYRRLPDSYDPRAAFIFAGVDNEVFGDYGLLGGGGAGQEFDIVNPELGTPPHTLHLARADNFVSHVSMLDPKYELNGQKPFSDMVYFEASNGGAVFSAASMSWAGALSHNDYDNDVSRITENVLRRFIDAAPLVFERPA